MVELPKRPPLLLKGNERLEKWSTFQEENRQRIEECQAYGHPGIGTQESEKWWWRSKKSKIDDRNSRIEDARSNDQPILELQSSIFDHRAPTRTRTCSPLFKSPAMTAQYTQNGTLLDSWVAINCYGLPQTSIVSGPDLIGPGILSNHQLSDEQEFLRLGECPRLESVQVHATR